MVFKNKKVVITFKSEEIKQENRPYVPKQEDRLFNKQKNLKIPCEIK